MHLQELSRLTRHDLSCVDNVLGIIDKYFPERLSPERLSAEVGLSKKKLQAGFRQRTGLTVHDYILKVRVEKAKVLLACSSLPLKAIAASTGFKTCSHFCKVFKTFNSSTPMEFRLGDVS